MFKGKNPQQEVRAELSVLLAALKACGNSGELESGVRIHSSVVEAGVESDMYVANSLITMYGKCGSLVDAAAIFESMRRHSVVSWTALMLACVENGEEKLALEFYSRMRPEGCLPNGRTFVVGLKACTGLAGKEDATMVDGKHMKVQALKKGISIHSEACETSSQFDIFVASALVEMYAKCGTLENAQAVFSRMPQHDVVTLVSLMLGYVDNGEPDSALVMFSSVQVETEACFVAAVKACTSMSEREEYTEVEGKHIKLQSLEKGMDVHCRAASCGADLHIYIGNSLIDMYAACGSMLDARRIFDKMQSHTLVSWNALLLGYAEAGEEMLSLELFRCIEDEGLAPDARSFVAALKACTIMATKEDNDEKAVKKCLEKGMVLHSQAVMDIFVGNTLVDMYSKCGSMVEAQRVFDEMPCHSRVTWTALVLGYAENGEEKLALELFSCIHTPDSPSFVAALKACIKLSEKEKVTQVDGKLVKLESLDKCMDLHFHASRSGHSSDKIVATTLVDAYGKCGSMLDSRRVFDRMQFHSVISWTSLLRGYVENGEERLALELFAHMKTEGFSLNARTFVAALQACSSLASKQTGDSKFVKTEILEKVTAIHSEAASSGFDSDIFVASILVDLYTKCGTPADAHKVFDRISARNLVLWNSLMMGYAQNGGGEQALQLFFSMDCAPDSRSFVAALQACGSFVALDTARELHALVCRSGFEIDQVLVTCLVGTYGKCGSMIRARLAFDSLFFARDAVTWNALIAGYSCQGDTNQVFYLFRRMCEEGLQADGITFMSVLSACSHAGLLDKGWKFFAEMHSKYGVRAENEHHGCMVDMLARANHLDAALRIVKDIMPADRSGVAWLAILSAARKWKNLEVAKLAFETLVEINGGGSAAYMLMSSTFTEN